MRITGGEFGGRIIKAPANLPVRPTTDYAKSGLFNILSNHFDFKTINVIDLFAGTGNISYEFISRGSKVTCVDENKNCIGFIKNMIQDWNLENLRCVRSDVFKFVKENSFRADIIFADPPFEMENIDLLPDLIFNSQLLKENGWLIVEHQSKRILDCKVVPFEIRKYGNCAFSIFRLADSAIC